MKFAGHEPPVRLGGSHGGLHLEPEVWACFEKIFALAPARVVEIEAAAGLPVGDSAAVLKRDDALDHHLIALGAGIADVEGGVEAVSVLVRAALDVDAVRAVQVLAQGAACLGKLVFVIAVDGAQSEAEDE